MTAKTVAMIIILLYNVRMCQSVFYNNYTLMSVTPTTADQLQFLKNLETKKYIDVIFWKRPSKLFEDIQFILNPNDRDNFKERTDHFRLTAKTVLHDVGRAFEEQHVRKYLRHNGTKDFSWFYYHSLEDIYLWLSDMVSRYSNVLDSTVIGHSAEGRPIIAMSVKSSGNKNKAVIVEGGIHGNEWIAVEFVTYLLNELVDKGDTANWRLHELARKYNWYLIPVINPDGYVYSHTRDRLWRKNRRVTKNGVGVDLNRNFDHNFGKYDSSIDPEQDNYCGTHPFSEPESKILADFVTSKKNNLRFYFSFHAYGQKIIIPFADRIKHIDNYAEMENFGKQALMKIYKMYGTKYSVGTIYDTLGTRISGNSASWVKKSLGIRYVFTFLLRDNGTYGYALPPDQILPTCKETAFGLTELMVAKPKRVKLHLFNKAQELRAIVFLLFYNLYVILLLK